MKGLLIKDFGLLKEQKKFFFVVIILAISMAFLTEDTSFILGYMMLIMPMFSLSTINYDEFDNGNAFLFTLPINRSTYVLEKYCFTLILGCASAILAVALTLMMGTVTNTTLPAAEMLLTVLTIFALSLTIASIMTPLQIKYGAEKGRIATLMVGGISVALGFCLMKLLGQFGINIASLLDTLETIHMGTLSLILIAVTVVILLLSMAVSIMIIKKKEF